MSSSDGLYFRLLGAFQIALRDAYLSMSASPGSDV